MKKLIKSIVFVAVAAMALVSCQKNEFDGVAKRELQFYINAGVPETKTLITDNGDRTYTPSWKKGDEIGIFFTEPTVKVEKVDATFSNTKEDGPVASFEGTATVKGEGKFYAFYPKSAFNQHYGDETIRLDLSAAQKPTSTSFDPSCDILVAKPCEYLADGETVVIEDLYFARMMSVLKINLLGVFAEGEVVESLSFEVEEDANVDITGNAKVDYKKAEITAWNNGSVKRNIVTASYTNEEYITVNGANKASYLVVAPVTITTGTDLTFKIKTTNYNITKTVTVKEEKPLVFPAGNIAVINLTIEEADCEERSTETRIWVDGFDEETTNKTQTSASKSGAAGTGVSNELTYSYSESNCNIRINNNGQTSTNPFLYINAANASFTASKIKIANEENLALSAMVKGEGLKLTVEYKESASLTWSSAGKITGTSSYAPGRVIFAVPTTATSLDIRLTGNGVMFVDDIVLESTDEEVPVVTLESIAISNQKIEYSVGDAFVKPTVTAIYSDETTKDVTSLATFSECDMNTAGDKTVTVTYEGMTAEYKFTVKDSGTSSETVEWVATSFENLKAGDEVVIVGTTSSKTYAMSNDKGTSNPPIPVEVSISGDKLTSEPATNIVWHVGVDESKRVFYAKSDKSTWAYCTNTNNGVRVGTNANKTFTIEKGYLKHVVTSRYLGIYNTQDWRCYTSTTTNIADQTFQFFVKSVNASGETPDPEPDPTPDPEPEQPTLSPRNLKFSSDAATATVGQTFTAPTLSGETSGVTYSSSNTAVATVNASGVVTLVGAGTTIITAAAPETAEYEADTASYTLTVSQASTTKSWKLVKDASTLKAGDKLAIVSTSKGKIASATISSGYMTETTVTISNNSFAALPTGAAELTLGGSSGSWTLTNASGKKLGATAVKKVAWGSGTTNWTITIESNGNATIQSTTSSYGRFLHNVGSPRFTTYTSAANTSMLLPQIYRYE